MKKWCNSQPDEGEHKLTYEAVLKKAKEYEAGVREYIHLAEENLTMTTAFQQKKQAVIDAFKAKRYKIDIHTKGALQVPEKDHGYLVPANRNCPAQTMAMESTKT